MNSSKVYLSKGSIFDFKFSLSCLEPQEYTVVLIDFRDMITSLVISELCSLYSGINIFCEIEVALVLLLTSIVRNFFMWYACLI